MSDETLAQEEIDALLQAAQLSSGSAKKELADEVAEEFLISAKKILLALLGNDVSIDKVESGPIPIDMLSSDITEPVAVAMINSNKGLSTIAVIIINEKKATVATDLILMGKGEEKDKFTDNDIDALKEAVNQIMGHLGQSLTGKYGETVSFEQSVIQTVPAEGAIALVKDKLKEESFHNITYSLKITDKLDTTFRLLLPLSIESEIKNLNRKLEESKALSQSASSAVTEGEEYQEEGEDQEISAANLDMILDLKVEIVVKLGEALRPLSEITKLVKGNILSLDKAANAPVDVIVNNKTIARGELIVIPPYNFAIKVTEVKDRMDRIKNISFH